MTGDWKEWGNHVLTELKRHDKDHYSLECKLDNLLVQINQVRISLAVSKIKHSFWGALGGAFTIVIYAIAEKFLK